MTDSIENAGNPADDMGEYLQIFLDETEEQLDDLVETMLALERVSTSREDLNEAFRLIHSIKGSAGMMGFDTIMVLTHHLENRFERFRSGKARLDELTMNLVLRCIDFLRQCNNCIRDGEQLGSPVELLDALEKLEEQAVEAETDESGGLTGELAASDVSTTPTEPSPSPDDTSEPLVRMVVRFRSGLQLADLKARLILNRLSTLGEIKSTNPDLDRLADEEPIREFEIRIESHEDAEFLRAAASVAGVESIEFPSAMFVPTGVATPPDALAGPPITDPGENRGSAESHGLEPDTKSAEELEPDTTNEAPPSDVPSMAAQVTRSALAPHQPGSPSETSGPEKAIAKVAETMRVDIDRLDSLMNLAGELVVNRARFLQISGQISPALRKANMLNRVRDFSDGLRRTIEILESHEDHRGDWAAQIQQLREGLELMEEQSEVWDNGRSCFNQIGEAINQLSRVSNSIQHSVLDIRMVPVGPLFNRFKRVVRDLSKERGKQVGLVIRGEKTELDKRMIDEMGDPLVHLVRNSIDHGLEAPDVRASRGKSAQGTIILEANHSGNNVYIRVRDDGGGIDVKKIKAKLVDRQLLSEAAVNQLSDERALEYIWHPGFSTAGEVTDVSGRGVGMDVVKTRITHLNGTIEVSSTPEQGTAFAIRLPLTLAIINSLLIRLRNVVFSVPVDNVREIVSLAERDVVTVSGKQTFDVRGEFIPLVSIDGVFQWHGIDYGYQRFEEKDPSSKETIDVVILHAGEKIMGLRVDELMGSQDIVIKSLSDNFMDVRGLSGASVLGDGSVCLMVDVSAAIDMATRPLRTRKTKEVAI